MPKIAIPEDAFDYWFAPKLPYVHQVGIELEGFANLYSCADLMGVSGGMWTDDAGVNLCEAITVPCATVAEAVETLRLLVKQLPDVRFVPFRPEELSPNKGVWHAKPRYGAILAALKKEKPEDYEWVNSMTDFAALQVNISGKFDPFGDDGAFLANVFNDIAPYIAAQVHQEIGRGHGHLSLWQRFAREERLPSYGRWFRSGGDMVAYIESIPKLIRLSDGGYYELNITEQQCAQNQLDLGLMWWFLRPKLGEYGEYLEMRFLPSMPPDLAERYINLVIEMVEVLLGWFHGPHCSQLVVSAQAATPAYRLLAQFFPDYIPATPLMRDQWFYGLNN